MMDTPRAGSPSFGSLAELVAWLRRAPAGTLLDAAEVARIVASVEPRSPQDSDAEPEAPRVRPDTSTWRERLWDVPSETRLGVAEAAEALGRPKSYVYARTGPKATDPLPHRKLDGTVLLTAGELRAWIRDHEVEVVGGPMEPPARTLMRAVP
jgi:hypothetical protein